jgi:GNAT superfamily N-acetyltransferase
MALIHGHDPDAARDIVARVGSIPALLFCAGDGLALVGKLGDGWSRVGAMPFMTARIADAPACSDPRVRRATPDDRDAVVGLWTEAVGIPGEVCRPLLDAMLAEPDGVMGAWVLEHEGEAVSTLTTGRAGDAITIWCMATPPRFARRGFGRALLADAMARAASDGVAIGLLGATPAGKPLYDATGWSTLEEWEIYTNGDSAQFA